MVILAVHRKRGRSLLCRCVNEEEIIDWIFFSSSRCSAFLQIFSACPWDRIMEWAIIRWSHIIIITINIIINTTQWWCHRHSPVEWRVSSMTSACTLHRRSPWWIEWCEVLSNSSLSNRCNPLHRPQWCHSMVTMDSLRSIRNRPRIDEDLEALKKRGRRYKIVNAASIKFRSAIVSVSASTSSNVKWMRKQVRYLKMSNWRISTKKTRNNSKPNGVNVRQIPASSVILNLVLIHPTVHIGNCLSHHTLP